MIKGNLFRPLTSAFYVASFRFYSFSPNLLIVFTNFQYTRCIYSFLLFSTCITAQQGIPTGHLHGANIRIEGGEDNLSLTTMLEDRLENLVYEEIHLHLVLVLLSPVLQGQNHIHVTQVPVSTVQSFSKSGLKIVFSPQSPDKKGDWFT